MSAILLDTNAYTRYLWRRAGPRSLGQSRPCPHVGLRTGRAFHRLPSGAKEKANRQMLEAFLAKPVVRVFEAGAKRPTTGLIGRP